MKNVIIAVIVVIISSINVFAQSSQSIVSSEIPETNSKASTIVSGFPYTICNESIKRNESINVNKTVVGGEVIYNLTPNYFKTIKSVYISLYKNSVKKTIVFSSTFTKEDLTKFKEKYGFTSKKKVCINVTTENSNFIYGVLYDRPFDE